MKKPIQRYLKLLRTATITLVLLTGLTANVAAATLETQQPLTIEAPSIERQLLYSAQAKEPWLAVAGSFFIPSLGHAYAGNWGRGAIFLGAELIEGVVAVGCLNDNYYYWSGSRFVEVNTENDGVGALAYLALVGTRIWEYVDAYKTAEKFNADLRNKLSLTMREGANGQPQLILAYSF